jgi:hypothetical protein
VSKTNVSTRLSIAGLLPQVHTLDKEIDMNAVAISMTHSLAKQCVPGHVRPQHKMVDFWDGDSGGPYFENDMEEMVANDPGAADRFFCNRGQTSFREYRRNHDVEHSESREAEHAANQEFERVGSPKNPRLQYMRGYLGECSRMIAELKGEELQFDQTESDGVKWYPVPLETIHEVELAEVRRRIEAGPPSGWDEINVDALIDAAKVHALAVRSDRKPVESIRSEVAA